MIYVHANSHCNNITNIQLTLTHFTVLIRELILHVFIEKTVQSMKSFASQFFKKATKKFRMLFATNIWTSMFICQLPAYKFVHGFMLRILICFRQVGTNNMDTFSQTVISNLHFEHRSANTKTASISHARNEVRQTWSRTLEDKLASTTRQT